MNNENIVNNLMQTPIVRNLGLKKEIVESLLNSYGNMMLKELLDRGHVELSNGMHIEIIPLTSRVHVLRGISYPNNRRYKLKLTMEDLLYEKIEEYYDNLQKEIE